MSELLVLITAIIFFLLGKYSHKHIEKEFVKKIVTKNTVKPGIINIKTPEEVEFEESEEAKDEKKWDKLVKGRL